MRKRIGAYHQDLLTTIGQVPSNRIVRKNKWICPGRVSAARPHRLLVAVFLLLSCPLVSRDSMPGATGSFTASAQVGCETLDVQEGSDGNCDWSWTLFACGCVDVGDHFECSTICSTGIVVCTSDSGFSFLMETNCL